MRSLRHAVLWIPIAVAGCSSPTLDPAYDTVEESVQAHQDLYATQAKPAPAMLPVTPEVINNGPRDSKRVALTFDACSTKAGEGDAFDGRIVDELVRANVPATIFVGGSWARKQPAQVKELAANPLFELGNHTYTHPHLAKLKTEDRIREELLKTQAEVYGLVGVEPKLFRPPFGISDDRAVRIAASLGLKTVQFDLASGDPDARATKEKLVEWVLRKAQPGSIIVMHLNHKKFATADALPSIIDGLRKRGFDLSTVGQMIAEQDATCADTPP